MNINKKKIIKEINRLIEEATEEIESGEDAHWWRGFRVGVMAVRDILEKLDKEVSEE